MAEIIDPASRLEKLLAQQDRRIAAAFRQAVAALRDQVDIDALADLIESGNINAAIEQLNDAARQVGVAYNVAFTTSGQSTAAFLQQAGFVRAFFDGVNNQAVAAMQSNMLRTVAEFSEEQRNATRSALTAGIQRGDNPRAQARAFRDSIGLTETQQDAVRSYREVLERVGKEGGISAALDRALRDKRGDAQIKRAVKDAQPLKPEKIDWLVKRYAERYVKYRSEVIGRTEALAAVNAGNHEMYRQAIEQGLMAEEDLTKQWHTSVDGRERRAHRLLNRQKRAFNAHFDSIDGPMLYPGDASRVPAKAVIQCRCSPSYRVKVSK